MQRPGLRPMRPGGRRRPGGPRRQWGRRRTRRGGPQCPAPPTGLRRVSRAWQTADRERGSIAPAVPIIALVLLLLGGLVLDASRQLNARGQAVAIAEETARAGAQAVFLDEFGQPELRPVEVAELVEEYCAVVRQRPIVTTCRLERVEPLPRDDGTTRPGVVVARVEIEIPASLLGIVGVSTLSASGEGRAQPMEGLLEDILEP